MLRWSTSLILAGGMGGLVSCDSGNTYVATAEDQRMAKMQAEIDQLDAQRQKLLRGIVENNFELENVGFYHAAARKFYSTRYNEQRDGKWFVNGNWQDTKGIEPVDPSRPDEETLKQLESVFLKEKNEWEQMAHSGGGGTVHHHHHSSGLGTGLMMYWLLSSNRGHYPMSSGFQQSTPMANGWQNQMENQRQTVRSYAQSNPGYSSLVAQSKASGKPVTTGTSVRGGFGSRSSGGSFGS